MYKTLITLIFYKMKRIQNFITTHGQPQKTKTTNKADYNNLLNIVFIWFHYSRIFFAKSSYKIYLQNHNQYTHIKNHVKGKSLATVHLFMLKPFEHPLLIRCDPECSAADHSEAVFRPSRSLRPVQNNGIL